MNKILITLLLFSITIFSYSQSWQWGKRGGALEALPLNGIQPKEQTFSLATDSNKNIYGLSKVGLIGLDIDNVTKTNFDSGTAPIDYGLFSFGCDGSYRWSKIIGGSNVERINLLQIDTQNNVYVSGKFGSCTSVDYPARIDDDFISTATSTDCKLLFLTKYNDTGVMQWIRMPQPSGVDVPTGVSLNSSYGIQTDNNNVIYWLTSLSPGSFANGEFVNTQPGSNFFILKYDSNGNYLGSIPINMQFTGTFAANLLFKRNPFNGNFYFTSGKLSSPSSATISGNSITHSTFLASFDSQGNYLWHREDTFPDSGYLYIYDIEFDSQNNIYVGGKMAGFNFGSFLGMSISESLIPGFVLKTNPTATQLLWSSYNNKGSENYGDIVLNGDELGYTSYCFGNDFAWGAQTLNASGMNEGQKVLLARFNKNTGSCVGLTKIPTNIGFNDLGASITADASGDYIVGGAIGGTMYFNNNLEISNSGSQSDFFVAKYAMQACSPLAVQSQEKWNVKVYPNPTKSQVTIGFTNLEPAVTLELYDLMGRSLYTQPLSESNGEIVIPLPNYPSGIYVMVLRSEKGILEQRKLVIE